MKTAMNGIPFQSGACRLLAMTVWLASGPLARSDEFAAPCADREAIERVYHAHRIGTKPPFSQAMPREHLERLIREDQHKQAVLRKVYGIEITPGMVEAEVRRIEATTRAPEMLAEIKQALGNDRGRFARAMVVPILVERELRFRFDNDDAIHAARRREAEQARGKLLAKQPVAGIHEMTWQLAPRAKDGGLQTTALPPESKGVAASGTYSVEATARPAKALAPASGGNKNATPHFEDLDPALQQVLRAQLREPGDVSAVIETPGEFLIMQAREITVSKLVVGSVCISKRSYDEWLAQQPE